MNNIPINEAESIFDPFWNHENVLKQYTITIHPQAKAEVTQTWCGTQITIYQGVEDQPAVTLSRSCRMEIAGFDTLRFFLSLQKSMRLRVSCQLDEEWETVIDSTGDDSTHEYDGRIGGEWLTGIKIEMFAPISERSSSLFEWMGMANSVRQKAMESRKSAYTTDWPGCFEENTDFFPQLGLYFDRDGLEKIRKKAEVEPFRSIMNRLREEAAKDCLLNPESQIGTFVPRNDRRWERDRDMGKAVYKEKMANMAFVGLVDKNPEFQRMACRMALSICHCTYWFESVMGHFPGATWHHRSFTEEEICTAVTSVLDWAGGVLTPYAKDLMLDCLMMKGLPRIESDFKVFDYIWGMNQGVVFSEGRIHALLALAKRYPRYNEWLDMAERDFREIVDRYILDDGGTLEGPGYWNYTFRHALPTVFLLARRHGQSIDEYVWDKLRKTGDMGVLMLAAEGEGTGFAPINDAHGEPYAPILPAFYSQISDLPQWKVLYTKALEAGKNDQGKTRFGTHNAGREFLIMAPEVPQAVPALPDEFFLYLPQTMQCACIRRNQTIETRFHYLSGPVSAGHYHEDKGSFILEVNGEAILLDRGVCGYHSPYVTILPRAEYHNLLMPESGSSIPYQQTTETGKITMAATYENGRLRITSDLAGAWTVGIFESVSRSVDSPDPETYVISDHGVLCKEGVCSFRLNTRGTVRQQGDSVLIQGQRSQLRITPVDWKPDVVWFDTFGVDEHLEPVNQLRFYTIKAKVHRLTTKIEVLQEIT